MVRVTDHKISSYNIGSQTNLLFALKRFLKMIAEIVFLKLEKIFVRVAWRGIVAWICKFKILEKNKFYLSQTKFYNLELDVPGKLQ